MDVTTLILGAGAAGLMCAARAGPGTLLIDHARAPGEKIRISGGGRCNFTNLHTGPENFLSQNPHFCKSALKRYSQWDFIELVDRHGIAWHEKTLGQLFCDGKSTQIVEMLLAEMRAAGAELWLGTSVIGVRHDGSRFSVVLERDGQRTAVTARNLVLASGGKSIPKMGATGFAYDLARQFGLKLVEPRPALVPLTLGGEEVLFRDISGVSAPVVTSAGKARFAEAALFTHRGLSGPAILQASSYWRPGEPLFIDFLPEESGDFLLQAKRETPRATLRGWLRDRLPARLADILAERLGLEVEFGNAPDKALRAVAERLKRWTFQPNGTEGYAKAEVTVGGIATAELSSKTMAAKRVPGLYAIGEAVDVTGWLGGYNFQWAWASAFACAQAL